MWLACYTQREIGEKINIDHVTAGRIIDGLVQNNEMAEMHQPPDFISNRLLCHAMADQFPNWGVG